MTLTAQIAKNFREVHFGGNWTWSNLKDNLADVTWEQATRKIESFNTIAALVYHINYYVRAGLKVLNNQPLDSHDKYSFDVPPIQNQADWEQLLNQVWADAETFASLVEQLPDSKLHEIFALEKYGDYFRNLHGVIEHTHYHLGQIVIIKKMILLQEG
ncbi:MAG: DinB family protein [Saprospiraceae bacterium]|nr:DinB family protein [Saprospiraceae bacterium]